MNLHLPACLRRRPRSAGLRPAVPQASSLASLALLLLAGCAHQAEHIVAPNSTPLQQSGKVLTAAVTLSRAAVREASDAVNAASKAHTAETKQLAAIEPKVTELLRVSPVELRPAVEEIQGEVAQLREEQAATTLSLGQAQIAQGVATGRLEQANAAKNEVEKLSPAYFAEVDKLAEKANKAEQGWAKDSKSLAWYRLHWLIGWIVMLGGIFAGFVVWAIKFTARGAAIAARF